MSADGRDRVERMAVAFATALRRAGVAVPTVRVVAFVDALGALGVDSQSAVYWAGRTTLVADPALIPAFDRVFRAVWLGRAVTLDLPAPGPDTVLALDAGEPDGSSAPEAGTRPGPAIAVRYSPVETLRTKDFAHYTHEEFGEARRLMADIRLGGALRRSRRLRRSRHRSSRPDVRRTVQRSLRLHGVPLRRAFLRPSHRQRRGVLLCDVSGSMERYTRALLRFLHAAVVGRGRVEAFALGTRLTRLTRELSSHDPDAALAAAAAAVADWSGGTRLGDAVRRFNDEWGVRGLARGAVVVILSDGWDRGDPASLAEQMARLRRVAHRVVWVNPLKATPGYAPLARGMAAALPYVDDFLDGHSLESLEELAEVITKR